MLGRIAKSTLVMGVLAVVGCGGGDEARYVPDVSGVSPVELRVERFDEWVAEVDTNRVAEGIAQLRSKDSVFTDLYLAQIVGNPAVRDSVANLRAFLTIGETQKLLDTVAVVYKDISDIKKSIESILRYKNYYFPTDSAQYKKLVTFVSLYSVGAFVWEDYIGVGLDFYLGEAHPAYGVVENLRFAYIRRTLNREHLPAKIAEGIADDLLKRSSERGGSKMVDYMIWEGKKYYLMDLLLPETPDSVKFGFSAFQMEYCQQGEEGLYEHLRKDNIIYSDKYNEFRKYVTVSPFDPEMGLYGNAGSWLGSQIVRQYVERTLAKQGKKRDAKADAAIIRQMLEETNAQAFLQLYKPRR